MDPLTSCFEQAASPGGAVVSIVVVTFQSQSHIGACLSSIVRFAGEGVQVIVVDNASTDATRSIVENTPPHVDLVPLSENGGFAAGVNIGASRADGRYILLLNPDAELTDGALPSLVHHLDTQPFVAAVGPQFISPNGDRQDSAFTYPSLLMSWLEFFPWPARLLHSPWNGRLISRDDQPITVDHPLGACMLVRRSAWRDVGPFDERFFLYCEEVDWCMRAKERGWLVSSLQEARVLHHGGASAAAAPAESIAHLYRSRRLLHRKHRGAMFQAASHLITTIGLTQERRRLLRRREDPNAAARAEGISRLLRREA